MQGMSQQRKEGIKMKLYAKIQSERASKGQGGKAIDITLYDENKKIIAEMSYLTDQFGYNLVLNGCAKDLIFNNFDINTINAKKQKDE